jgi:hypothetical protein
MFQHITGLGVAEGAGAADDEAPMEEEDIGDLMAEILAEEKRKKEELAAALKRDAEEAKKKCVWCGVFVGVALAVAVGLLLIRGAYVLWNLHTTYYQQGRGGGRGGGRGAQEEDRAPEEEEGVGRALSGRGCWRVFDVLMM